MAKVMTLACWLFQIEKNKLKLKYQIIRGV